MKTSQTQKPQESERKSQALVLSKKNLLELIETKKMKTARVYIEELRNSNPKAEKYIREVLEEIFCQKKVSSASIYMYALVFYKNLLISGELDYYEDNQFFPHAIHDTIAKICEYNQKQSNIKSKGKDYFKSCVKIEPNEKVKQDLEAMGVAIVIYAMQILQSMAEWYKDDYFTGEETHFLKAYNSCIKKGIIFSKKSEFIYIKEQDKAQFEQNYKQLFQENSEDAPKQQQTKKSNPKLNQTKKQKSEQDNSKLLQFGVLESKDAKGNRQKESQSQFIEKNKKQTESRNQRQILNEPKTFAPQMPVVIKPESLNKKNQSLLSKVQQKKAEIQDKKTKIQAEKSYEKDQKTLNNNSSFDFPQQLNETSKILQKPSSSRQPLTQNNKHTEPQSNKQGNQKDQSLVKKLAQSKIISQNRQKSQQNAAYVQKKQPAPIKIPEMELQKKQNSQTLVNPSPKRNFKRTEEQVHKGAIDISFPPQKNQPNYLIKQNDSKILPRTSIIEKRKHKIFQKVPQNFNSTTLKPSVQKPSPNDRISFNMDQLSDGIKINILGSNVSFSPNFQTDKKYESVKQSPIQRKRSVPKTEKKYLEKTFAQHEELALKFGLTQNLFNFTQNKTSLQKFPMKTLSAWRCQKQIKRDFSPQNKLNYQSLMQILKKLKFKELVLPFVPQYFQPVTLKMFGLRKSSLQISGFTQTSQVFFNNKIIETRLMKPNRNSYVLSILNVSRFSLQISPADMKKIQHSNHIRIIGNGSSTDSKTSLHSGCYMDIHFTFQTSDLNFKFLPFNLLIDESILSLQLPVTLLDQCKVENSIEMENILSYTKKYVKIINSDPFSMNRKNIPNFIKNKVQTSEKSKRSTRRGEEDFQSFTLKMRLGESDSVSILSCCISPQNKSSDRYRLEIIFDSASQGTEAFAKVMVELLTFLLWQ